ncbi:FAD-dependent oxidoreductase [Larkinella insperata]|uniref:FAD-dependent oxidoreductase n=1 Tax=Larkinella insperata TaxID=332158 RepID=A0ABW3QMR6_9BACT|nr:FAD-dependent oxidoreductase [Larkinella insperata]
MQSIKTDALIIGFGKAGKTLAAYLAKHQVQTVLVEQSDQMYGGTCINIGCIPTKSLVVQAERKVPYADAVRATDELTAFLRQQNFNALDTLTGSTVITGKASFVSAHDITVRTQSSEEIQIQADRIFINTGTVPFLPTIPGLEGSSRIYTSTSLLKESRLPKKLVVIGGGFIGLEYASMYAQYGSQVTVLDTSPRFLPREDDDLAAEIGNVLQQKGITIYNGVRLKEIQPGDALDTVAVSLADGREAALEADAILVATGRQAYTDGLNVAAAGVQTDGHGFIPVNNYLQTNVPHIWALGDINGGPQFTYISLDDFRIIREQLFGSAGRAVTDRKNVPFSVFITPPYAHIGLREKEAAAQGLPVRIHKIPAKVVPRTRILNQTEGLLKAIVHAETDQILGFSLFCAEAHELINLIRLAMNNGVTFSRLTDEIYTHPSMTEAFNYFA